MDDWILNFTRGGVREKTALVTQARALMDAGLWGIPATSRLKASVAVGDRVLIYVGAPERVFVGRAVVAAGWHEWTTSESAAYPMRGAYRAGIVLRDVVHWVPSVPRCDVWANARGSVTNPDARWYGAIVRLTADDFDVIACTATAQAGAESRRARRLR